MGGMTAAVIALAMIGASNQGPKVEASLVPQARKIVAGKPFPVVIRLQLERPWHIYWLNPGDSGVPTTVEWDLPPGWKASPVLFPTPKRYESSAGVSYGHEGEVLLLANVTAPSHATGTAKIAASVDWLACTEACIPGQAKVSAEVIIGQSVDLYARSTPIFERAQRSMPLRADFTVTASATSSGTRLTVGKRASHAYFFARDGDVVSSGARQHLTAEKDGFQLDLRISEYAKEAPTRLKGVLVLGNAQGRETSYQIDVSIQRPKGDQER